MASGFFVWYDVLKLICSSMVYINNAGKYRSKGSRSIKKSRGSSPFSIDTKLFHLPRTSPFVRLRKSWKNLEAADRT